MTAIRLGLLGGFEVRGEDGEPLVIGMRKAKALLAWLALHPGRPQPRDRLAGLLWSESSETQARHSLRQALSVLRRELPDEPSVLLTEGDAVSLVADAVTTDVDELRRLSDSNESRDLERAAALCRGDFLEGSGAPSGRFEDWMLQERSALRELAVRVLGGLLQQYSDERAWEPALRTAMQLLALDPLRETVRRDLMTLYVRLGRPAEALRQYRSCKALVHRELGVAPEAATVDLYRRILAERSQSPALTREPEAAPEPAESRRRERRSHEDGIQRDDNVGAGLRTATQSGASDSGLVGREAELRQLSAALDACVEAGAGSTLLVRGEAGIGKTTLSEAAAVLAREHGFETRRLRLLDTPDEVAGASTCVLLRGLLGLEKGATEARARAAIGDACTDPDALLFLLDALGVPLEKAEARFYSALDIRSRTQGLHRAAGILLRAAARRRPRLLVVEDIHWADAGLLGLLAGLAAEAGSVPAMLVLTTRTEGEPLDPGWRGAMQGAPLTTLDLGPLRPEAAVALARLRGAVDEAWTRRCLERSGGNPLFLEHLLDAGPETGDRVPTSVQELVERQLGRLPSGVRRMAQAAAVLGQSFPAPALCALLGPGIDPFHALSDARLVSRDGDQLRFSHALVRDGIYQSIAVPARRSLHSRAAEWYRERDTLLHADHLERADDPGAVSAWLAAARQRLDGHRYEAARDLGERAWRLAELPGEGAEAGFFLAELQREMGQVAAARRVMASVIAGCEDERTLCDARIELAAALLVQDEYAAALRELEAASPAADALGDDRRLARLHYHRGNAIFPLGRLDDCMDAHSKALEHARAAGDPELEARALSGLADAFYQRGRMVTAHHYFDRCIRLCEAHDLIRVQAANLAGRAMTALYLNRLAEDRADSESAIRLAALTRSQRDECLARNVLSIATTNEGDFERAESAAEAGLALARAIGARRFEADQLCMRGIARAARGDLAKGLADLDAASRLVRVSDLAYGGPWIFGYLAQMTDDPEVRRAALAEGEAALSEDSVSHNHLQFRQCALEIALQERDWDALERHARAMEDYIREEPLPWCEFHVARARALMAWVRGDRGAGLVRRLRALAAEARQAGLGPAADGLEAALGGAGDP